MQIPTFADMVKDKTYQVIDHMPKKFVASDAQIAVLHQKATEAKEAQAHAEGLLADVQAERDELAKKLEGFDGTLEVAEKLKAAEAERDELAKKVAELEKLGAKKATQPEVKL